MITFKLWLEEHENSYAQRKNYFDQVMRVLQATEDDLSRPLDELPSVRSPKPENGESQPPQKGQNALAKVQSLLGNILQKMSHDRVDTDTSVRANRTMELLRKRSNDGKVSPELYLQDLLRELFGNDFHEELIDQKSSQDNTPAPIPDQNADIAPQQNPAPDMNDPSNMDQQMAPDDNMGDMEYPSMNPNQPEGQSFPPKKRPFGGQQFG